MEQETSGHSFPDSGKPIEMDIYVPELRLGIEYQGEQHYRPIEYFGGEKTFEGQRKRDAFKRQALTERGFNLVEIPYTWDKSLEQLKDHVLRHLGSAEMQRLESLCHGMTASPRPTYSRR